MKTTIYIKRERKFGLAKSQFTPIELDLPEDSEIEDAIIKLAKESTAPDRDTPDWMLSDIRRGAKWLRDKIKQQLKIDE